MWLQMPVSRMNQAQMIVGRSLIQYLHCRQFIREIAELLKEIGEPPADGLSEDTA
jgi:hypothetical protein